MFSLTKKKPTQTKLSENSKQYVVIFNQIKEIDSLLKVLS